MPEVRVRRGERVFEENDSACAGPASPLPGGTDLRRDTRCHFNQCLCKPRGNGRDWAMPTHSCEQEALSVIPLWDSACQPFSELQAFSDND